MPRANQFVESRAAITTGAGDLLLQQVSVAPPGPNEVRIRVVAAGVCHTDHASLSWGRTMVLGHEGAGIIDAVGPGVTGLAIGQPVCLNWAIPCGACPQCARGNEHICDRTHGRWPERFGTSAAHAGSTLWGDQPIDRSFHLGVFSDFTIVRKEAVSPLPAGMGLGEAALLGCAVMTGVGSALNVAQVRPGETVAVVGCGGVGLNVIQGARIAGASRIIAMDLRSEPLERARHFGATDGILVQSDDPAFADQIGKVRALTDDYGVDVAFEATGSARLSFLPLHLVRNGGRAIQVSGSHGAVTAHMPDFMWDKSYSTALYGGCCPTRDFPRLFTMMAENKLHVAEQITHHYGLESAGQAISDMLSGVSGKGLIWLTGDDHVSHA